MVHFLFAFLGQSIECKSFRKLHLVSFNNSAQDFVRSHLKTALPFQFGVVPQQLVHTWAAAMRDNSDWRGHVFRVIVILHSFTGDKPPFIKTLKTPIISIKIISIANIIAIIKITTAESEEDEKVKAAKLADV